MERGLFGMMKWSRVGFDGAVTRMDTLYEITDALLAGQAIGFLAGLCVSVLLIVLVRSSWGFPAQRRPGVLLSLALVVWNLGGLLNAMLIIRGFDYQSVPAKIACAFGYSGLTFFTWAVLAVWRLCCKTKVQRNVNALLQGLAIASGLVITVWLWMDAVGMKAPLSRTGIRIAAEAALYALVLTAVFVAALYRPSTTVRICAGLTAFSALGPLAAAALIPIHNSLPQPARVVLSVYAEQSVNFVVVAAFILLARLRFTDTLVEHLLQGVTALSAGSILWYFFQGPLIRLMHSEASYQPAGQAVVAISLITALLVLFPALNRVSHRLTERLFQQPDFDGALQRLADASTQMACEDAVLHHAETIILELFERTKAHTLHPETLTAELAQSLTATRDILEFPPGSRMCFDRYGVNADVLVPVRLNGRLAYAISIERSPDQRGFLLSEISFLRSVGHTVAARLEMLKAERERNDREQREATLLHQTTEAELRALRAQVNPHFLFNALNTIADLIVVDAKKAERMTEQLSDVFRYVLLHSQQQTITLREEIDFVRRYLDIEEARFGERLAINITVDPAIANAAVPAFILQPVVENAVKHGLAPKVAGGMLAISVRRENGCLCLTVEDDGVGLAADTIAGRTSDTNGQGRHRSTGVGLANISERLRTLYGDRAHLLMESPRQHGCRVTIRIPHECA